jgi:two-component system sensor histidine kinase KdpD
VAEAEHAEVLRRADRMREMLLASLSHDLRTPLTAIKALAQGGAQKGETNAAAIEEQADLLARLVGDLLDWSRIKAGALPVNSELNTAEDLIGAVARQFAATEGVSLKTDIDWNQPALVGQFDFVLSFRILNNLVENAARHTAVGTDVLLSVRLDDGYLVFGVADRGPGVAPEERERIFEPFYRPIGAPPDAGRAGLGLSIARRLAEAQGGRLDYSARDGGGSVFRLFLPAAQLEPSLESDSL